jgi:photosystem II stability/assembly factor-like uncharacterized protein
MRSLAILLVCILLISCHPKFTSSLLQAQWTVIDRGLPSHAPVLSLVAAADQTVYAAAYDRIGVYKSQGALDEWTPDNRGLDPVPSFSLLLDGGTLWAGTAAGLYERNPGSGVWRQVVEVPAVAVYSLSRSAGGVLFAGTDAHGVFSSQDEGKSWARLQGLGDSIVLSVLGVDAQTIFVGTSGQGMFVTHNAGSTWQNVPDFGNAYVPLVQADPRDPRTLYGSTRHALLRSRDGGRSWVMVEGGLEKEGVYALLFSPDGEHVLAGTAGQGIFSSADHGESFQPAEVAYQAGKVTVESVPQGHAVLSFGVLGDSILAGTTDGVILSTDQGRSWTPHDYHSLRGIGTVTFHDLVSRPSDGQLFAATEDGLYTLTGGNWRRTEVGSADLPVLSVAFSPADPGLAYVGTSHEGVFVSRDGGRSWTPGGGDLGGRGSVSGLVVDPGDPKNVFARVLYERIYKSTNAGNDWHTIWTGMRAATEVETVAIDAKDPATMYAGGNDELFHSNDAGERWVGGWLRGVSSLAILIDPLDSRKLLVGTTDGLYSTIDGGMNWARAGLAGITVTTLARGSTGRLFAGTRADGVYISDRSGTAFRRLGSGLEGLSVIAMVVEDARGTLFAATSDGMFCLPIETAPDAAGEGASCR